jgi:hypothetical protein
MVVVERLMEGSCSIIRRVEIESPDRVLVRPDPAGIQRGHTNTDRPRA